MESLDKSLSRKNNEQNYSRNSCYMDKAKYLTRKTSPRRKDKGRAIIASEAFSLRVLIL